ncbi:MAG: tetratricopeptide repeat protein [Proteobacteria bacterium]|uniref:tetratricopeptide repeat protein n=1 Tax=Rudaea sp. TaxID=2136325 RepID=UPI001E018148|nr:tetratricopeptide repeat protein [Pseudomonadota bacterium]
MNAALLPATLDTIATLIERGDFTGAERRAQAALQTLPPHAEIWRLLGIAQIRSGRIDAAARSLQQAHRLDPNSVEVLCNLAAVEIQHGDTGSATRLLERALRLAPNHVGALNNLGRLRHQVGDYPGAAQCFERSLREEPHRAETWFDLANASASLHDFSAAESHLRQGLALAPRSADGWYVLGYIYERQGRLDDALQPYRNSMELSPRPHTAHNLALVEDQLGDWQAAARTMEHALQLAPNLFEALSQLVYIKRRLCEWRGLPELAARLVAGVDAQRPGILPFSLLVEETTPAQQLGCARTFARQFAGPTSAPDRVGGEGSPLRVGFVSSGFKEHATGLLVVELIERLRATGLTTVAFATTAGDGSELRHRLEHAFHEFHDVGRQAPEAIAERIRAAHIDVLIDIDGYCMNSLPRIFALRPAPIQVNWLAYPGSLGAPWYDYLIADDCVVPPSQRAHYDENIATLPRCYQPTDTTRIVREAPSREALGLPADGFVYCCFNASWKITPQSFALWVHILREVPDSVLWLLDERPGNGVIERLRDSARRAGVDPLRLIFAAKTNHADYLARYRRADLFLDTNPYNAHTTASDALYAGCPVLTRPGDTFASRVAASLNRQIGLDDMVVANDEAYAALAIELARQPTRVHALRARLGAPAARAQLFDMQAYADDFAALIERIAERARSGQPPQDISL